MYYAIISLGKGRDPSFEQTFTQECFVSSLVENVLCSGYGENKTNYGNVFSLFRYYLSLGKDPLFAQLNLNLPDQRMFCDKF